MKFACFGPAGSEKTGIVVDDWIISAAQGMRALGRHPVPDDARQFSLHTDLPELLEAESGLRTLAGDRRFSQPISAVRLGAPVPRPGAIICLARNYREHAAEQGVAIAPAPVIFGKVPSCVTGPADDVLLPESSANVDFEVELGAIIGKPAFRAAADQALSFVAGYCVINDISARDLQKSDGQYLRAKSLRSFCPMGPWLVTSDELIDPADLYLELLLNGTVMQSARTSQMIHSLPRIIEFISRDIALEPGYVIATGTPAGVGAFRTPPVFLADGDRIHAHIEHIGTLENSVRTTGVQ